MATTVQVKDNQSLFDIALQVSGNFVSAFDIAQINDLSLTDRLSDGMILTVSDVQDKTVVVEYNRYGICPATEIETDPDMKYIGNMIIGVDFMVF